MNSDLNQLVDALTNLINDVLGSRVGALEDKASQRLVDIINVQARAVTLEDRIEALENADMDRFGTLATSIRDLEARAEVQMEELGRCNHTNRSQDGLLAQLLRDNIELRRRLDKLEKKLDLQEPEPVESSLRSPEAAAALVDLIEANPELAATICSSDAMRESLEEMLEDEIKSNNYLYDKVYDTVRDALRDASVRITI